MSSELAPPPPIAPETMRALLAATGAFAAAKPWEHMYDSDVIGLTDPVTGDIRLCSVLGNAGEVFGAVFYRRATGMRWLLSQLDAPEENVGLEMIEYMDALKIELLPKQEMLKEDLDVLKRLNFKPSGRGCVWPQFQSLQPGWLPWFIDQAEAQQLLVDLPRLMALYDLFRKHPSMFIDRPPSEIPFLPHPMPDRPLRVEDLDWRPMLASPEACDPFQATGEQLAQLRSLQLLPKTTYEYGCSLIMRASVLEKGRPCYSRVGLLVEHRRGLVLGAEISLGTVSLAESAGGGLVKVLLNNGVLPGKILIQGTRLEPILGPLCRALDIELGPSDSLSALASALAALEEFA